MICRVIDSKIIMYGSHIATIKADAESFALDDFKKLVENKSFDSTAHERGYLLGHAMGITEGQKDGFYYAKALLDVRLAKLKKVIPFKFHKDVDKWLESINFSESIGGSSLP